MKALNISGRIMQIEIGISQISLCGIKNLTYQNILNFYLQCNIRSVSAVPSVLQIMQSSRTFTPVNLGSSSVYNSITHNSIQGVLHGISPLDADLKKRVRKRIIELDKYLNDWNIYEIVLGSIPFRENFDIWKWVVQEFRDYVEYRKIQLTLEMICNSKINCDGDDHNLIGGLSFQADVLYAFDFANSLLCLNHNYEKYFLSKKISSIHLSGENHTIFGKEDLEKLKKMISPKFLLNVPVYWEFLGYNNWVDLNSAINESKKIIKNHVVTE